MTINIFKRNSQGKMKDDQFSKDLKSTQRMKHANIVTHDDTQEELSHYLPRVPKNCNDIFRTSQIYDYDEANDDEEDERRLVRATPISSHYQDEIAPDAKTLSLQQFFKGEGDSSTIMTDEITDYSDITCLTHQLYTEQRMNDESIIEGLELMVPRL